MECSATASSAQRVARPVGWLHGSSGSEFSDDDISEANSLLEDEELYVPVDCKSNPHFGAADLQNNGEFKPARRDLYGHRGWMVLTKNGVGQRDVGG